MDKLLETPWFLKVVSFLLAVLLYVSTNFDFLSDSTALNTPAQKATEVLESVPVEVYYDRDNLVVTGIPETVDVTLEGPKNLLVIAKNSRDFKLYVDLSDPEIELGKKQVEIQVSDLNDRLTATINPETVEVLIQEKITKEFIVKPEFDRTLLEDGYIAEEPQISPTAVKITGAKSTIESIVYVKAIINLEDGVRDSVTLRAQVQAFDKDYNKLDVEIDPGIVEVEVPIVSPSKTMAIVAVKSGEPAEGISITDIEIEPSEVTLYGKQEVLDTIENLRVPIDISNIQLSTSLVLPLDLPEGVTAASVEEVKVNITAVASEAAEDESQEGTENEEVDVDVSRVFPDLRIQYLGLDDLYELTFLSPTQGVMNVSITGKQSVIDSLESSDIQVSIDVSDMEVGEHSAPIAIKTPVEIVAQSTVSVAKISISMKEAAI